MTPTRVRNHLLAPLVWIVAGAFWLVQLFLPWTSSGTFSTSTMVDGIRLIRSGEVESVVPGWIAPVLLVLPAAGLGLIAVASLDGVVAALVRVALGAVCLILLGLSVHYLVDSDPGRLGPGGWTAGAGGLATLVALCLDRTAAGRPQHLKESTS